MTEGTETHCYSRSSLLATGILSAGSRVSLSQTFSYAFHVCAYHQTTVTSLVVMGLHQMISKSSRAKPN